ncbi:regulator of vacuolar morphogenesis, partial [Phenoliferia sp. Uapishka_3]
MGAPALQSLTIPSHTTRQTPSPPHVVYHLTIRTSHSTYTLTPRYSTFAALHAALSTELGTAPPGDFPQKHPYRGIFNPFSRGGLSEAETIERRQALEKWLRGLVMDRDRRWVNSKAMKEFLAAPEGLGEDGGDEGRWTSTSWLTEQGELAVLSRTVRAGFAKRDGLIMRGESAAAYVVEKDGKKGLVELVTRLGSLTKGLSDLAKGGMPEGEITRRKEMVQRLQDDVESLGVAAGAKARTPMSAARAGEAHEPDTGGRRAALLGAGSAPSKNTGRVLGAAAKAKETAETRPLDNGGLLQLQDQYVADQDSKLEGLAAALRRQKDLGLMIADELAVQDDIINGLEGDVDRVGGKLKSAEKTMRRLG